MSGHQFIANADHCVHCGTLKTNSGCQTVCPGPQRRDMVLRPEPARREYAVEDIETIHARLAELRAEQQAAINQVS